MTFLGKISASASALAMMAAAPAGATVLIEGTGLWGSGTATTAYSKANTSFQFSFTVSDPLDANPTTAFDDFNYTLNGHSVTVTPTSIAFYTIDDQGMFAISFGSYIINIYGADIGSTGSFTTPASYAVTTAIGGGSATGLGFLTVTEVPPIPEPASWTTMLAGFGLTGAALRRRRTVQVACS